MWDSSLVMSTILSMEINGTIMLCHYNLGIIIRKYLKLDNLTVQPSKTLEGKLSSIEYFNLWGIYAGSYDISLIVGYLDLICCNLELEILNELYSLFELLVIAKRFVGFFCLLQELRQCLPCRHVVVFYAIDLSYFVHVQQY